MTEKQKSYWDNFDNELYQEYLRQKQMYKFKKQQLKKQMLYN